MRTTVALTVLTLAALGLGVVPAATVADPAAERTVDEPTPAPGERVTVTLTVDLDGSAPVDVVENFEPSVATAELVDVEQDGDTVLPLVKTADPEALTVITEADDVESGALEIVYEVTIPEDAAAGDSVAFESVLRVDGEHVSLASSSTTALTVDGDAADEDDGADDGVDVSPDDSDDGTAADPAPNATDGDAATDDADASEDADGPASNTDDGTTDGDERGADSSEDSSADETGDELPGFGVLSAVAVLGCLAALRAAVRRRD